MDKDAIEKIRPEARKLVIKSYIINLTHQLYRDIWLKFTIAIITMQLLLAFGGMFLHYVCDIETVSTTFAGAIGSWACCVLIMVGSFISRKAMKNAQETKGLLYRLIDSYVEDKIIESDENEGEE